MIARGALLLSALVHRFVHPANASDLGTGTLDLWEIRFVGCQVHFLGGLVGRKALLAKSSDLGHEIFQVGLKRCSSYAVTLPESQAAADSFPVARR